MSLKVEGITGSLKEAFLADIVEKDWMDEKTKQKAIEKVIKEYLLSSLHTLKFQIGIFK